jgi:hypothetical protein
MINRESMSDSPTDFLYSDEAIISHRCPFCTSGIEPKTGKMKCPECHAKFEYGDRMESIFIDVEDLRLPVHGAVCPQCGLVQGVDVQRCMYCGNSFCSVVQ